MAATNKTEVIPAAVFRARQGRKSAAAALAPVMQNPNTGLQWLDIARKEQAPVTVFPISGTGEVYTLTYSGVGLSSNKWYAGMHWRKRQDLKDEWRKKFHPLIVAANMGGMQAVRLHLRYRSKHDADNCTAMIKLLVDQLKGWFIPDDTPKHFKGFSVEYDEELPHNTFIFTLTELV